MEENKQERVDLKGCFKKETLTWTFMLQQSELKVRDKTLRRPD